MQSAQSLVDNFREMTQFNEAVRISIIQQLLNTSFNINLQPISEDFGRTKFTPDLVELIDGRPVKIAKIYTKAGNNQKWINQLSNDIREFYDQYGINLIILVFYDTIKSDSKKILLKYLSNLKIDVEILGVDWFNEQLKTYPDVVGRFLENIKDSSSLSLDSILLNPYTNKERAFFAAGYHWDNVNMLDEFISSNRWENGHEKSVVDAVNSATKGDILLAKSTWVEEKSKGVLSLNAIGVVKENQHDGHNLRVNWYKFPERVDSKSGSQYRYTFQRIREQYLEKIIGSILKRYPDLHEILTELEREDSEDEVTNPSKIANLTHDTIEGEDFLRIDEDVTAFAKVIASNNFAPPLAIALFGQWGSGKSFFMQKLSERIRYYADSGNELYNRGIAQIHFNAWSYMDANLWASIVSRIFEGLNIYINEDTEAKAHKEEIEEELNSKLRILQEERKHYEDQIKECDDRIKILEKSKSTADNAIKANLDQIKKDTLKESLRAVDNEFSVTSKLNSTGISKELKESFNKIKDTIPEKYQENPDTFYHEATSTYTFIREFFRKERLGWNAASLMVILGLIVGIPPILDWTLYFVDEKLRIVPQILATAVMTFVPIWRRVQSNFKRINPIIGVLWKMKEEYHQAREVAIDRHNREMDALKIEIEQRRGEAEIFQEQIMEIDNQKRDLSFRLNQSISTETLYNFIEQRAKGDIYKKHLGIISTIRSDFEVLSELFQESKEEEVTIRIKTFFKKPLQRIVLYIDDLDRCPEDRVIQVLEAVNLIMAFPLFVVVVGVDPRWVRNALVKQYQMQFSENPAHEEFHPIEASDYLEKIFQIPFHLKEAEDREIKEMLTELSKPNKTIKPLNIPSENKGSKQDDESDSDEDVFVDGDGSVLVDADNVAFKANVAKSEKSDNERLLLSEIEVELIQHMSGIIGSNPRAIKRFVNVYHIVRAHSGLTIVANKDEDTYLVLMFLLALPMGKHRKLFKDFCNHVNSSNSSDKVLRQYLNDISQDNEEVKKLKADLSKSLSGSTKMKALVETPLSGFMSHIDFTKRFVFSYSK